MAKKKNKDGVEFEGTVVFMCIAVQLYTGNRDGQVEALDLREMGSFSCEVSDLSVYCCAVIFDCQTHVLRL